MTVEKKAFHNLLKSDTLVISILYYMAIRDKAKYIYFDINISVYHLQNKAKIYIDDYYIMKKVLCEYKIV